MDESDDDDWMVNQFHEIMKVALLDSECSRRRRRKRALDNDEFMMAMMSDGSDNSNSNEKFENKIRKEMLDVRRRRINLDKRSTYFAAKTDIILRLTTLTSSYIHLDDKKYEMLESYELAPDDTKRWRMNDMEDLIIKNKEQRLDLDLELKLLTENYERNIKDTISNNTNSNSNTDKESTVSSISIDHPYY